ncbi:hypothetical protein [Rhodococcus koreensis]|uniref:hypothetical protein n=1 Tax=Rhodococcus koreensis TaxID=99653 RepID=UPI00197E726E|nr:hypothetical protein [Rhodococcus koreensis]QSE86065.1 hypothetical protein JWS14_44245 [Rhodococcus koreensis]
MPDIDFPREKPFSVTDVATNLTSTDGKRGSPGMANTSKVISTQISDGAIATGLGCEFFAGGPACEKRELFRSGAIIDGAIGDD